MLGRSAMIAAVAVVAAGLLVVAPVARAHRVADGDVPHGLAVHGGEENYNGRLLSRHARKGMGMSAANDAGDGELRVEQDPYGRTMGKGGSSMGGASASDGGTQDRVVVTEVGALKLRFTGELSSPVVAKKGKKESSIVGTTSGGVTWSCTGDATSMPLSGFIVANGSPPMPLSTVTAMTVLPLTDSTDGINIVTLQLFDASAPNVVTHECVFDGGCSTDSGLSVGDTVGPFEVVGLSTTDCPGNTALDCSAVCVPPAAPAETSTIAASTDPGVPPEQPGDTQLPGETTPTPEIGAVTADVTTDMPPNTNVPGVTLGTQKTLQPAVCTFGIFPGGTGCSGPHLDQVQILGSVGFTTAECAQHTTSVLGFESPLYLTAQPVCKSTSAEQRKWTMCSWQPDASNQLCKLSDQQCCNYVIDYVDHGGVPSVDVACQQYLPGECRTMYGYNGTHTQVYSAILIGCVGQPPTDPQCAVAMQRGESTQTSSSSSRALATSVASAAMCAAVVVLAMAFMIRRRRLAGGYTEMQQQHVAASPRDPLLTTSVLNYTDDR